MTRYAYLALLYKARSQTRTWMRRYRTWPESGTITESELRMLWGDR